MKIKYLKLLNFYKQLKLQETQKSKLEMDVNLDLNNLQKNSKNIVMNMKKELKLGKFLLILFIL